MAIEAVLKRHEVELARQGVEVTPRLVQLLLRLVKEVRERQSTASHPDGGVRDYYAHLDRLGLTERDLLTYAHVLGKGSEAST